MSRNEEQVLVDAIVARIPTWKVGLLTNVGRATLTKTTLSAILVHVPVTMGVAATSGGELFFGQALTRSPVANARSCGPSSARRGNMEAMDCQTFGYLGSCFVFDGSGFGGRSRTPPGQACLTIWNASSTVCFARRSPSAWGMALPRASRQMHGCRRVQSAASPPNSSARWAAVDDHAL